MSRKVFISYSHKDESYKDDLNDHLSAMKRSGLISVWHDRKIVAGVDWSKEIDSNLEHADIILLLVSSSFLASDYCYEIELKRAIEKHENGSAVIVPVIIRACDWSSAEFSRIQAVPKDGLAISSWSNGDEAWMDAIEKIKKITNDFSPKVLPIFDNVSIEGEKIKPIFYDWLNDTGVVLTNRNAGIVKLEDIYVFPDLSTDEEDLLVYDSLKVISEKGIYTLSGEEQQGKTSLLKRLFIDRLNSEWVPIYINAREIKKADIMLSINSAVEQQYWNLTTDEYLQSERKIILIDNIDEIRLNERYRSVFLERISNYFDYIVLTCHSSFRYVYSDVPIVASSNCYEISLFGHQKREELIKRWISVGKEESICEQELYSKCTDFTIRINTVVRKNIVPPKPIHILLFLQMFEANDQLNLELASYGHCYQQLIYHAFNSAKIPQNEFDKYLNILTELAWDIFISDSSFGDKELDAFFKRYSSEFLPVNKDDVIIKLNASGLIDNSPLDAKFKYPYVYYFFVGKKIAESYSDAGVKGTVSILLEELYKEDYANILIFVTHHTKDVWVLNEIMGVLNSLFEGSEVTRLERSELLFMSDFVKKIPEIIIEQREIQNERENHNRKLDELERFEQIHSDELNEDIDTEPLDILAKINKTFKGMEIAGQIIRNRHATLKRNELTSLAENAALTGLRFLHYFLEISGGAKEEVVALIANYLSENPELSNDKIEKFAEDTYLHLTFNVIKITVSKIASSIGSKEADVIYKAIEEEDKTPALILIRQAISFHFKRDTDLSQLSRCAEALKSNPVCMRILKEMVVQHVYMYPVNYKEKQKLSELFDIPISGLNMLEFKKNSK